MSASERERLLGQSGCVVWLTGLSGSGKSTIARLFERRLVDAGRLAYVLDGDTVRKGLTRDLGFTASDRAENIRRVGEVAALFADAGLIVAVAFISPFREGRAAARLAAGPGRFLEVFVDAPLPVCESRDPKGLYRRARAGELPDFTGVSSPYEPPETPDLVLRTDYDASSVCVDALVRLMLERGFLKPGRLPGEASETPGSRGKSLPGEDLSPPGLRARRPPAGGITPPGLRDKRLPGEGIIPPGLRDKRPPGACPGVPGGPGLGRPGKVRSVGGRVDKTPRGVSR